MDFCLVSSLDAHSALGRFLLSDEVSRDFSVLSELRFDLCPLSRPRSMVGGDLHWIWKPYSLYQEIDYVRRIESSLFRHVCRLLS
jgi:hypothetical protein